MVEVILFSAGGMVVVAGATALWIFLGVRKAERESNRKFVALMSNLGARGVDISNNYEHIKEARYILHKTIRMVRYYVRCCGRKAEHKTRR